MSSQAPTVDLVAAARSIIARYPAGRSRSALLPLLHLVQERDGYVTEAGMAEVASILGISTADVRSVATFYTMFYLRPKGRRVISVCHNIACSLMGAERVISALESRLGVRCGQTTPDGAFTLERVECLAACELAPMVQIDFDQMIGPVDASDVDPILQASGSAPMPEQLQSPASQGAVDSEASGSVSPEEDDTDYSGYVGHEPFPAAEAVTVDQSPATPPITSAPSVEEPSDEPTPAPPEPPLLIDSIPLTSEEREITERLEARRGEHRSRPSPAEKLAELPPLEGGVGTGPEVPEHDDEDAPHLRPRGTE